MSLCLYVYSIGIDISIMDNANPSLVNRGASRLVNGVKSTGFMFTFMLMYGFMLEPIITPPLTSRFIDD